MTLRKRLMGESVNPVAPKELLEKLSAYPHITSKIEALWGHKELQEYFDKLFSDTRGNTRKGFPLAAGAAIMQLGLLHAKHLESRGIKLIHLEGSEFASKA